MIILSIPIQKFAALMQMKLNKNSHKSGWKGMDFGPFGEGRGQYWREKDEYLLKRLDEEVTELKQAISEGKSDVEVAHECADVANFAMMIADVRWDALAQAIGEVGGSERE